MGRVLVVTEDSRHDDQIDRLRLLDKGTCTYMHAHVQSIWFL